MVVESDVRKGLKLIERITFNIWSDANTVRLVDLTKIIAPCLVAIICAGEPRPYRAAKSPNTGGLPETNSPKIVGWGA